MKGKSLHIQIIQRSINIFQANAQLWVNNVFNVRSFWNQFGQIMKENTFDKHFEKPDTLQELLDDDLIITEFKNQNSKLMEQYQQIFKQSIKVREFKDLINYIIVEPLDDSDSKRAFRYPFYSCELLCCDNVKVMDMFFPKDDDSIEEIAESDLKGELSQDEDNKQIQRQTSIDTELPPINQTYKIDDIKPEQQITTDQQDQMVEEIVPVPDQLQQKQFIQQKNNNRSDEIFNYFCSFVTKSQGKINDVLAGYFCKVFNNIFQRKQDDVIKSIYSHEELDFMNILVENVDSRSLAEVLLKLLSYEKMGVDQLFLEEKLIIIKNLINHFKECGAQNFEIGANVQMILQDICQKAYTIQNGKEILQYLITSQVIGIFFELMTNENIFLSIPASNIVQSLLSFSINDDLKSLDDDDGDSLLIDSSQAFTLLASYYPLIFRYLQNDTINRNDKIKSQMGHTKIKLVEIIYTVLRNKQDEPKLLLAESDIFAILNPLLQQNAFNNFYHLLYHKIVTSVIEQDLKEIIINMFEKNNLLKFLSTLTEGTKSLRSEDKTIARRGYLGFIIQIGKFLDDFSARNSELKDRLSTDEWSKFKDQFFTRAVQDNEQDLGGLSNNRDRTSSEAQFDFNRQEIENRYAVFLNNNPSSPPLQQNMEQFTDQNQDQVESQETTNNIFETFGQQRFSGGSGSQQPTLEEGQINASFDGFNNVGWGSAETQSDTKQQFGWDNEHKIVENDRHQDIQLFWKLDSSNEISKRAFLEFDSN